MSLWEYKVNKNEKIFDEIEERTRHICYMNDNNKEYVKNKIRELDRKKMDLIKDLERELFELVVEEHCLFKILDEIEEKIKNAEANKGIDKK